MKRLLPLLLLTSGMVGADDHPWSLTIDTLADSADARSLYLSANVQLADGEWLYASTGAGRIDSTFETIDTDAITLGFTHDFSAQQSFGIYYDTWSDSTGLETRQLQLPWSFGNDRMRVGLTPGYRQHSSTVLLGISDQPHEQTFDDWQLGSSLTFTPGDWRFYLSTTQHRFDPDPEPYSNANLTDELRRLGGLAVVAHLLREGRYVLLQEYLEQRQLTGLQQVLASQGPQGLAALLRFQARRVDYLTSLQPLAQSLSDNQWTLEIARGFGLSELSLEHSEAEYVLDGLKSRTNTLRFLTPLGASWDLMLQAGQTRTEGYDPITFYGASFTRYF